jgi:hypothetical protein
VFFNILKVFVCLSVLDVSGKKSESGGVRTPARTRFPGWGLGGDWVKLNYCVVEQKGNKKEYIVQ